MNLNSSRTINVCQEFFRNPDYNPRTLRRIKRGAKKYEELVKECGEPEDPLKKFIETSDRVSIEPDEPPIFDFKESSIFNLNEQDRLITIDHNCYDVDELYQYILNQLEHTKQIRDPNDPTRIITDEELSQIFQMKNIHKYPPGVSLNHQDDTNNLYQYFVKIQDSDSYLSKIIDLGYVPSDITEQDTDSENTSDMHAQLVYQLWDENKILDSDLEHVQLEIGKPRWFWNLGVSQRQSQQQQRQTRVDKFIDLLNQIRTQSDTI